MKRAESSIKPACQGSGTERNTTKVQELMYELKVEDAMTRNVIYVTPETPMAELREILRTKKISGTPVVKDDAVVGMISIEDLIRWLVGGSETQDVRSQMTTTMHTLYADEPLVHAVNKLGTLGFGRFPVIERETNALVGIITNGDVVKRLLKKMEIDWHDEEIHTYRASHIFSDLVADGAALSLHYHIEGVNMKRAGVASSSFKKSLSRLGIDPASIRRAAIASYEAEMNMIIYSSGGAMDVKVKPGVIDVTCRDLGPGIPDVKKAMEPGFSTAPDWVREMGFGAGMGLANIQKHVDQMELTSTVGKGTTLKMTVYYRPHAEVP